MKIYARFSTYRFLIVLIAIILTSCKAKKLASNQADTKDLKVKFERLFIEACTQYNVGNYSVALSQFNKCADIKPEEASVYYELSRVKQKMNDGNACFQYASKANTLAPYNKFYAYHYGLLLRNIGDYKKAQEILSACIEYNLKDETLYNQLDEIYAIQKALPKQIELWNKYKSNAGLKSKTGLKLIELYKRNNDFASAHSVYDELKKGAPNKTIFYIDDAKLYELQKDEPNAILNYEKAISINPNNWDINYALFQFYNKKKETAKATQYLTSGFQSTSISFETILPACASLLKSIKTDTANCLYGRIAANTLRTKYQLNSKALLTAGQLVYNCSEYARAGKDFELAAQLNPNLYDAWIGALDCNFKLKQTTNVILVGEKALEYFPNTVLLYEKLAEAYNIEKKYDKALELVANGERYIFDDTAKASLLLQKSISQYYLKNYSDAKKTIEEAIVINKQNPTLYDLLGNLFMIENNIEKAIENWKLAKDKGSNNNLIDKKIRDKKLYE